MRADCDERDDADLIEEVMLRTLANGGRLVSRRAVRSGGSEYAPSGSWMLTHSGPAIPLAEHDWIDIRNQVVENGSMCRKCGKLRAENV